MTTAKVWSTKGAFKGEPTLDDFVLTEETLPPVKDGEILVEALYLSVDPYIRVVPIKDGLPSDQVARIVESKADGFPVGALVTGYFGWRSRSVVNVNTPRSFGLKPGVIDVVPGLSPSLWIGAIGMPGMTAYLSFLEKCYPVAGEVIVVSAAAGAVGTIVGQLAKLQGLTVIGLVGSNEKRDYIKEIGFDHAINYKTENISSVLDQLVPGGVDIYYDTVGGDVSDAVYAKLRHYGRVLVCGQISKYNTIQTTVTNWTTQIITREIRIQGFQIYSPASIKSYPRVIEALVALFQQGKLKAKEHVTEGFENMPKAFIELFAGANIGKAVVKISGSRL